MSDDHAMRQMRLRALRGMPCPLCRQGLGTAARKMGRPCKNVAAPPLLEYTGLSLNCEYGHGWSNPDALMADMREALSMPLKQGKKSMPDFYGHFADLSHWDDANVDLHAYAAAGAPLIVLKASQGQFPDPTYAGMRERVRTVEGLVLGAYPFLVPSDASGQLGEFNRISCLQSGDLFPVLDAEALGLTRADTVWAAAQENEKYGGVIIYCNLDFLRNTLGGISPGWLWLADYSPEMPAVSAGNRLFAWQHTQNGSCPGIASPCDMSYLLIPDLSPVLIS